MKGFYHNDFLLYNEAAKRLFHEVAAPLPVIDPHNHIDPAALATNKKHQNLYQLWVQNDPYKHRAMRICGVEEELITGNRSDYDKFLAWAHCFPDTAGNPLFHWCCMELKEIFGIDELLNKDSALSIWNGANQRLAGEGYGARDIVKKLGVQLLCTSDDLLDSLEHHQALAQQGAGPICLPSLRSDSIISFDQAWLHKLQAAANIPATGLDAYKKAIVARLDFFDNAGCLLADHSLDSGFAFIATDTGTAAALFQHVLSGQAVSGDQLIRLQSHLLQFLGMEYAKRSWKMQLHIGAHRHTSTLLRKRLGPAGGYAAIGNAVQVASLSRFLDSLDREHHLPKTILYTLNPADNPVFASLTGSFAEDGVRGKIQFGPAWWYNDHLEGITQHLITLSSYGLLSTSIGMTTDSRSVLSFVRHNYFRRILCNLLGSWMEEGKMPNDFDLASRLVKNICYDNIKNWLQYER